MRKLSKKSPFFYPLTEGSVSNLFDKIFIPATKGFCVTVKVRKNFGGGRALTRFMMEEFRFLVRKRRLKINPSEYLFIYIDPDDLVEGTKFEYMNLIYRKVVGRSYKGGYLGLVDVLRKKVRKIVERHKLVVILRGINYLDFADGYLWGNVKSVFSGVGNVGLVFISYSGGIDLNDKRFERIRDLLGQKVVEYNKISPADVSYSINRWSYLLGRKFKMEEVAAIKKISEGKPMLIKQCCLTLSDVKSPGNPEKLLENNRRITELRSANKLVFSGDNKLFVGNNQVTYIFSSLERNLLVQLIKNSGEVVSKDEIAKLMWGRRVLEKYSESAMAQIVKRVRSKLELIEIPKSKLQTISGEGYLFNNK